MIKEAIDRILELYGHIEIVTLNGREYCGSSLHRVELPQESQPVNQKFTTLTGLRDFAANLKLPIKDEKLFFHIENPSTVKLLGALQPDNYNRRFVYAVADLYHDSFMFSGQARPYWYNLEMFVIALQSLFVPTDTLKSIIDMVGNLANESIQENKDDGFSQTLQVRSGISNRSRVKIENPVSLKPWRTFREVDQPESNFILRFFKDKDGIKASLWEADGGVWRFFAMQSIGQWFANNSNFEAIA
jgi:hypothetical protein